MTRTLILAACCAALFAAPAPAQLTPGLVPTAEDCIGCNTTFVQPPPIGGHDGCTIGEECDYVPSVPTGPNTGETVESPCWLLICPGGDDGLPPLVTPVVCGELCQVYDDVAQPAPDPEPAPADPPVTAELPYGGGCDWTYCDGTGSHVTIGAT